MYTVIIFLFVIVAILLIFVILIQSGKGGGLAGTFGGAGDAMGSIFGGRGSAPFLTRITTILATLFMFIALLLGMITRSNVENRSLVERERERRMESPARTLPEVAEPLEQGQGIEQPPAPQQ